MIVLIFWYTRRKCIKYETFASYLVYFTVLKAKCHTLRIWSSSDIRASIKCRASTGPASETSYFVFLRYFTPVLKSNYHTLCIFRHPFHHTVSDHHRPASEMPLNDVSLAGRWLPEWSFAGGPMVTRMAFHWLPEWRFTWIVWF